MLSLYGWSSWVQDQDCMGTAAASDTSACVQSVSVGDLWVVASAIPWAIHVLLVGRVAHRMGAPFMVAGGQFLVCSVLALAWGAGFEPLSRSGL